MVETNRRSVGDAGRRGLTPPRATGSRPRRCGCETGRCVGSGSPKEGGSVRNMSAESRPSGLTRRDAALILGAVGGTAGIGAAATTPVLSSRWYRRLDKPPWQPPGPVFGPVWSVIYALIAASMLVARGRGGEQQRPLFVLFGTNLALNLAWTLIFFRGRSPVAAGVEIVALEGTTIALVVRAWPAADRAQRGGSAQGGRSWPWKSRGRSRRPAPRRQRHAAGGRPPGRRRPGTRRPSQQQALGESRPEAVVFGPCETVGHGHLLCSSQAVASALSADPPCAELEHISGRLLAKNLQAPPVAEARLPRNSGARWELPTCAS
jgi:benzodiazapine receptor